MKVECNFIKIILTECEVDLQKDTPINEQLTSLGRKLGGQVRTSASSSSRGDKDGLTGYIVMDASLCFHYYTNCQFKFVAIYITAPMDQEDFELVKDDLKNLSEAVGAKDVQITTDHQSF